VLLVIVLAGYAWAGGPGIVAAQLRAPALATLAYGANWQQLAAGHGYFQQFAAPNPLVHTWSLAIEEQFYLVWPILIVGVTALARRREARVVAMTAGLALGSACWSMVAIHRWGIDRAYLGTDTRAWELLAGALVAMVLRRITTFPDRRDDPASPAAVTRRVMHRVGWSGASIAAAAGLGWGVAMATGTPGWLWDGGIVAVVACVAVIIAASVRAPTAAIPRVLALPPLRWLGRISYSLYLWHWPVVVLMTRTTIGLSGAPLLLARLGAMSAAASASFYLVEQPLRRADWGVWWRRALVPVALAGTAVTLLVATITPVATTTAVVQPSSNQPADTAAVHTVADALGGDPAVSPLNPVRIWLFGDSVLNDASPGVTAAFDATGDAKVVANTTFPGWSFAHDPQWPSEWEQVIASDHPQVVMATWSWDDQLARSDPTGYEAFLRRALDVVMTPGDGVKLLVLLQFPETGPPASAYNGQPVADPTVAWESQAALARSWNAVAARVVSSWPGHAVFLTTSSLFDPDGRYLAWFKTPTGSWLRARKIDNVHFCPYGAATFGAYLVTAMTPVLHLGPEHPGWETGAWADDPRYDDPPGACPDDHPPSGYRGVRIPA
jgi:peptidoglycan/LPS O-acetylase OafA/YrhL